MPRLLCPAPPPPSAQGQLAPLQPSGSGAGHAAVAVASPPGGNHDAGTDDDAMASTRGLRIAAWKAGMEVHPAIRAEDDGLSAETYGV